MLGIAGSYKIIRGIDRVANQPFSQDEKNQILQAIASRWEGRTLKDMCGNQISTQGGEFLDLMVQQIRYWYLREYE